MPGKSGKISGGRTGKGPGLKTDGTQDFGPRRRRAGSYDETEDFGAKRQIVMPEGRGRQRPLHDDANDFGPKRRLK